MQYHLRGLLINRPFFKEEHKQYSQENNRIDTKIFQIHDIKP